MFQEKHSLNQTQFVIHNLHTFLNIFFQSELLLLCFALTGQLFKFTLWTNYVGVMVNIVLLDYTSSPCTYYAYFVAYEWSR